ncbi:MAG: hypothetical protein AAB596_01845 [Patescibacteria group bacterium]
MELFFFINKGLHILTAISGVGAATLAEIFYLKAIRDGIVDESESKELKITYKVMRLSLIILIFTGLGMMLGWRWELKGPEYFYNPVLLAKFSAILILLLGVSLMHARKIPIWLGGAISLVSWYGAAGLGKLTEEFFELPFSNKISYLIIMLGYFVAIVITAFVLKFIHEKIQKV